MNKRILLVLSSSFVLGACSQSTTIRPERSDDTITTTVSIINSDDFVSSLVSGIKTKDLQAIIDNSKLYLDNIRTSINEYAYAKYNYVNGYNEEPTKTVNSLVSKELLYDNSVLHTTNTAITLEDYQVFNLNNGEEKKLSSVKFISDDFKTIETRSVYQKDGETLKTVRVDESISYTQDNYDKEFSLVNSSDLIDAVGNTDKIELSGVLNNGQTMVRYVTKENVISEVNGYKDVETAKVDYFFTNSLLTKINTYYIKVKENSEGIKYPQEITTLSRTFSTTQNGKYDKAQLPEVTKN